MLRSGHKYKYRVDITNRALIKYQKLCEKSGGKLKYRSKYKLLDDKSKLKYGKKSNNWFKSSGHAAVLNVPTTPGGTLRKAIQGRLARLELDSNLKLLVRGTWCQGPALSQQQHSIQQD